MAVTIKRSIRSRYMRLRVLPGGAVVLTVPMRSSDRHIQQFLHKHALWLERAIEKMQSMKSMPVGGRRGYTTHKEAARRFIEERVQYWNRFYNFSYSRIAIKNTRTLWGSCSKRKNLNFSYLLLFLPLPLADYVVVHELCHLKELNHLKKFWALVGEQIPDYKKRRRELKTYILQ